MTNSERRAVVLDFLDWLYKDGLGLREGSSAIPEYDAKNYVADEFLRDTTVKCDDQCSRCVR